MSLGANPQLIDAEKFMARFIYIIIDIIVASVDILFLLEVIMGNQKKNKKN